MARECECVDDYSYIKLYIYKTNIVTSKKATRVILAKQTVKENGLKIKSGTMIWIPGVNGVITNGGRMVAVPGFKINELTRAKNIDLIKAAKA